MPDNFEAGGTEPMQEPTNPPPAAPAKKASSGKKILIWVLVILGLLLILAVLIIGGAAYYGYTKMQDMGLTPAQISEDPGLLLGKILAAADENIEFVSSDKENKTVTLRNKATGETVTVDLEAIETGEIPDALKAPESETAGGESEQGDGSADSPETSGPEE